MTEIIHPERILSPPRERGALDIANRVVAKIAARAVGEAGAALVAAKVHAELDGRSAAVTVPIAVAYPRPVYEAAAQVRGHVTDRLVELVGVERVEVQVVVAEMTVDSRPAGRRVV